VKKKPKRDKQAKSIRELQLDRYRLVNKRSNALMRQVEAVEDDNSQAVAEYSRLISDFNTEIDKLSKEIKDRGQTQTSLPNGGAFVCSKTCDRMRIERETYG